MCSLSQSSFNCAHTFLVFLTLWFDIHAFSSFSYYICVNGFWGVIATPLWSCPLPVVIYESLYLVFCIPFASIFHQPAVHNRLSPPSFLHTFFIYHFSCFSHDSFQNFLFYCNFQLFCAWSQLQLPYSLCVGCSLSPWFLVFWN